MGYNDEMKMRQLHHKHVAIGFLMALLAGMGLGFYVGYDLGWESAVETLTAEQ